MDDQSAGRSNRSRDWEREREPYFERVLEHLEGRLVPGLRENIVTRTSLTPLEFETDLRSVDGAAFGPEPILTQSAWFRYHNRSEDVGGLYFVGASTHPGAGVPGVMGIVVEDLAGEHRFAVNEGREFAQASAAMVAASTRLARSGSRRYTEQTSV